MPPADLQSQPLRADFTHPSPTVVSAYGICRAAEHVVDPIQDHWPPDDPGVHVKAKLINIRILGHLLSQTRFLSDTAIATVATGIVSCRKDPTGTVEADVKELNELGEFYKNYFLRPFRKFKGRTPDISSHPSPPSNKFTKEDVDQMLAETPRGYSHSRDLAMQREDFRCIVTRILDMSYAERLPGIHEAQPLEFCHIFAESTNYDVKNDAKKRDYSCNAWGVLKSFGYIDIVNDFATAEKTHSLGNVMMMINPLHNNFDRLDLWFEPIEGASNCYRLRSTWTLLRYELTDGQEVTFQSADPRLELPNPEYLRIHAACCRVAHMSGASGLFDELERDLASDPDPTTNVPGFARALHAHLDHLSWNAE